MKHGFVTDSENKQESLQWHKGSDPPKKFKVFKAVVRDYGFEKINHLPCSLDLEPSDYYFSQNLKKSAWKTIRRAEGGNKCAFFRQGVFFLQGIDKLILPYNICIEVIGTTLKNQNILG